jgi:hypothetical protein
MIENFLYYSVIFIFVLASAQAGSREADSSYRISGGLFAVAAAILWAAAFMKR